MANASGSIRNKATYAYKGWDAEMVYVMPFSEVPAFIAGNYLDEYAASMHMAVTEIIDEPYMEGDVVDPTTGCSQTRKVTVRFSVVYLNVPWPDAIPQPSYPSGTTLKLHATYGGQMQPLTPRSIRPAAGPAAGPNTQWSIYVVLNEFHVEWGRVVDLASLDFGDFLGCVNADTFMGVPAGQLLLAGAGLTPSFVIDPGNGPCAWTASVALKQKTINTPAGAFGWNDWYNPATQQYEALILSDGNPPYMTETFAGLFS